jgi:DNA phosphorothioation-dependent restriction protein DptG
VETLSDGAREVIREKISEEVRRQYLEVTWTWFEQEALPDYLQHREKSLWDRYERRLKEMPSTAAKSSTEDLREEWKEMLADHLRREEKWLRKLFEKSTTENIEGTIRSLCAESKAGELRNVLDNLKKKNALDDLLLSLRQLWAEQFQPI